MVREPDGIVDVRVVASGRTSFEYTFTVTAMDLTASSKIDSDLCNYGHIEVAITPYPIPFRQL